VQLGNLQLDFEVALFNAIDSSCPDRRTVQAAIKELFYRTIFLYNGMIPGILPSVVTFFYRLTVHYIQQVCSISLSATTPPELSRSRDDNFLLCIATWGHHLLFEQDNCSLEDIACCLNKFVLLSRRVADSLLALSRAMDNVKSGLIDTCPRCKESFLENMLCHRCTGNSSVASCPSLCKNVVCNCFPDMGPLNDEWNKVLDSISDLINETNRFPNISHCMNSIYWSLEALCAAPSRTSRCPVLIPTVSIHTVSVICLAILSK
jgi:hypothetical protein